MNQVRPPDEADTPLVSIIIPMHNAAEVLEKTLDSLVQQTFRSFEVIMVDDCSTDNTRALASHYLDDKRFSLVPLPRNAGVANARNEGIERARGTYLCFLDADDWWHEHKLALQTESMIKNQFDMSYMDYTRIEHSTNRILSEVRPPATLTFRKLLESNFIGNLTAMVHRHAIGSIRFTKAGHEDYIFWLTILRNGVTAKKVPTGQSLCFYRVRPGSLSSNKLKAVKWQWQIYRRTLGLAPVPAAWYLAWYMFNALKKRG